MEPKYVSCVIQVNTGVSWASDSPYLYIFDGLKRVYHQVDADMLRIESLVQSLLKIALLDAGAITLEQSPENVFALLEHIKRQYSFRAEQEGKEIVLEGDSRRPSPVTVSG